MSGGFDGVFRRPSAASQEYRSCCNGVSCPLRRRRARRPFRSAKGADLHSGDQTYVFLTTKWIDDAHSQAFLHGPAPVALEA